MTNNVFEDAIAGIRSMAEALETEVGRMKSFSTQTRAEEHMLAVAQKNRQDCEAQLETVKAAVLDAKRGLEDTKYEAARVLADARKQATELVANARGEANQLIGDAT